MTDVTLRVHEDGADDERIEQLTAFLGTELRELVAVATAPGEAPAGAKALDVAELGTILTTISSSTVLAAVINAVSTWLGQRRDRSVTVEADGEPLELTGAPTKSELAQRSAWLGRHLHRYALIIASHEFADPGLSSLRAPAHDAARLGEVLADPRIGAFHVRTLINTPAAEVNEAVEDFFADREPDDLLVLHFSGHGVKDEAGELHFATSSTKLARLAGTAVSADFVARRMNRSRSRRIVLLLDCCYSGAFGRGMVARAGGAVDLEEQFGGSGRAVITASSAMEYAFEGALVADTSESEPSVFTSALVEGLESGDADRDQDGHVGLDELYEYVYDRVRRVTPHQTSGKWMLDVRGDLRIARRARPVSVPSALPAELQEAIDHSLPGVRAGAIPELRRMLSVAHEGRVLAARLALRRLVEDDSRMVAAAAAKALGEQPKTATAPAPPEETPKPTTVPAPTSKLRIETGARKLSVPPETIGRGGESPQGAGESVSIPTPSAAKLAAPKPEAPKPLVAKPAAPKPLVAKPAQLPTDPGSPPSAAQPPAASLAQIATTLPRLAAGLALTLLVIALMTIPGSNLRVLGETSLTTFVFVAVWPWALATALFTITCRDHPWAPGAALGLLAGTTGLLSGGETYSWVPYALAATALAVATTTTPWWLALTGGALGAAGLYVVAAKANDLTPIGDDGEEMTLFATAAAITLVAAYRLWRDKHWPAAIAPALLLLDVVLTLTAEVPPFVTHASLAGLIVVPLIATLTTGTAAFAAYTAVAAGLLFRASDYVSGNEPTFTGVAHVTLPLAAALVAYFSRSR
ncbi:caspase family protein [Lentzea sp. NPDC058436]|uniref:caspase family protein n=1 Tax=Lentzea sp. NPDC058436 TaxID=3346499 RepID=UPI00365FB845